MKQDSSDRVQNYTVIALTLGLLKLDHDDAIKMGDGDRILRLDSIMYLFYKFLIARNMHTEC